MQPTKKWNDKTTAVPENALTSSKTVLHKYFLIPHPIHPNLGLERC